MVAPASFVCTACQVPGSRFVPRATLPIETYEPLAKYSSWRVLAGPPPAEGAGSLAASRMNR